VPFPPHYWSVPIAFSPCIIYCHETAAFPLQLPSQAKRAQHIARDERVRAGIALAIRKRNSAANLQPLEINPTLSKKLADKKLRRKQRAAKRAERRLLNRVGIPAWVW
jgi:hypothetical protein